MSILSLPRLYFKGEMWWSTATANSSENDVYDRATAGLRLPAGITYDTLPHYLMGMEGEKIRCGHNYYGDNSCAFTTGTVIVGGTLANGHDVDHDDPIVRAEVRLVGAAGDLSPCRITDIDPFAGWSSQVYLDRLLVGDQNCGFYAAGATPMLFSRFDYVRNFNVSKDLVWAGPASVIWQTTFPRPVTVQNEGSSRLVATLEEAVAADTAAGLMIRFCTYRTRYYRNGLHPELFKGLPQPRTDRQLSELYLEGAIFPNPAWSLVVGVIGIWHAGEPATVPAGRGFGPGVSILPLNRTRDGTPPRATVLGPATAELDVRTNRLSIDLMATFPEFDSSALKVNFGTVAIEAVDAQGNVTIIGALDYSEYDQRAYEARAGIVDLHLEAAVADLVRNGTLRIAGARNERTPIDAGGRVPALIEQRFVVTATPRGVYLQQRSRAIVTLRVLHHGGLPRRGTRVLLAQYDWDHRTWSWILTAPGATVASADAPADFGMAPLSVRNVAAFREAPQLKSFTGRSGGAAALPFVTIRLPKNPPGLPGDVVRVGSDGSATVELRPERPGCFNILILPYGPGDARPVPPPTIGPDRMLEVIKYSAFITGRVLPFDDHLDDVPDSALDWRFIYDNILRVYDLLHPVTSRAGSHFPLNDEARVRSAARRIRKLTDPALFNHTSYMPVSRDLSDGKRRTLLRWLDLRTEP
jgi:hypothetical protein